VDPPGGDPRRAPLIAVCGAAEATPAEAEAAAEVGRLLAGRGAVVLCGGLGGVMAAVARGVASAGGVCVGLLPGDDLRGAAPDLTVAIPTGMGEMRNALLARASAGMIAVGGGFGTLSEIALGLRLGRPVVGLRTWEMRRPDGVAAPVVRCATASEAVDRVLEAIGDR
jgi:uncharacterized protein (TIGR00725 family)